jgi:hypothetical protein
MNRYLKLIIVLIILASSQNAFHSYESTKSLIEFDWQKQGLYWGMSRNDCEQKLGKLSLNGKLLYDGSYLSDVKYLDLSCLMYFEFGYDGLKPLISVEYLFNESYQNFIDFIDSYKKINQKLIERYGVCAKDKIIWRDERYKNERDKWGIALKEKNLAFFSLWKLKDKVIIHTMSSDNGRLYIKHDLFYYDSAYYRNTFEKDYTKIIENNRKYLDLELKAMVECRLADIYRRIKDDTFYSVDDDLFYKLRWGMSREEIKKNDGFGYLNEDDFTIYAQTTLFGYPVDVDFALKMDTEDTVEGLCYVGYDIIDRYKRPEEHLADFKKINSLLTKKYGRPYSESIMLRSNSLMFEPDNYLSAFESGDLRYSWEWDIRENGISLSHEIMYGYESGALHTINLSR